MSKLKAFATDNDKVKNGVWHEIGEMRFKLAYRGDLNPRYVKAVEEHRKPLIFAFEKGLTDEQSTKFELDVFLDGVLLDWEGVDEYRYTRENAEKVLKEYPQLLLTLQAVSGALRYYRPGDVETDVKN